MILMTASFRFSEAAIMDLNSAQAAPVTIASNTHGSDMPGTDGVGVGWLGAMGWLIWATVGTNMALGSG